MKSQNLCAKVFLMLLAAVLVACGSGVTAVPSAPTDAPVPVQSPTIIIPTRRGRPGGDAVSTIAGAGAAQRPGERGAGAGGLARPL